jgi:hypothetical protein
MIGQRYITTLCCGLTFAGALLTLGTADAGERRPEASPDRPQARRLAHREAVAAASSRDSVVLCVAGCPDGQTPKVVYRGSRSTTELSSLTAEAERLK